MKEGKDAPMRLLCTLWALVALELVLPVPGPLSLGVAYVLVVRPPWFAALVLRLYGTAPRP